jgi:hypothetical protein
MSPEVSEMAPGASASRETREVNAYVEAECEFRQSLEAIINGAISSLSHFFLSIFSPRTLYRRRARMLTNKYRHLLASRPPSIRESHIVDLSPYAGLNPHVHRMAAYLQANLCEHLTAALVHGSLGDYNEIPYSDFDGLVIMKRAVFDSPDKLALVAFHLARAQRIMYQFDPLQHHGWFVLVDTDLELYPDYYLPIEALRRSKSLLSAAQLKLSLGSEVQVDFRRRQFFRLSTGIIRRITSTGYPGNVYQLKSFLSQFMLLPACFIETLEQRGISKEQSFELARAHFPKEAWAIMDEVSQIRGQWSLPRGPRTSTLRLLGSPSLRFMTKRLAPPIPAPLRARLNRAFYRRVQDLTTRMISKLS